MFREGWVLVNSVPTHVMTWGGWIEDDFESDSVVVCVPGNPGITDFYYYFLQNLYSFVGIPIWIINHAGNEPSPKNLAMPSIDKHPELYNMFGQVQHKKEFLKQYFPNKKKLFLIGHSLGGKICAELMKDDEIASKVSQVHLLFPTLQHICESPNGIIFKGFIQYLIPVIVLFAWVLGIVPQFVQLKAVSFYFWVRGDWENCHQESCVKGTLKLLSAVGSKSSLTLAKDEMYKIKGLDSEVYDKYYDKIYCYFAQHDRWAPLFQYEDLMKAHPKIHGTVLEEKFTHAFVLTTPVDMAQLLSKSISPQLKS